MAFRRGAPRRLPTGRHYRDYVAWLQRQDSGGGGGASGAGSWRGFTRRRRWAPPPPAGPPGGAQLAWRAADARPARGVSAALAAPRRGRRQPHADHLLQGAWALLLRRYSGAGRRGVRRHGLGPPAALPGIEGMVGLFINTLPCGSACPAEAPASRLADGLQERHARCSQHEYSRWSTCRAGARCRAGVPLFESLLVFENYPIDPSLALARPAGQPRGIAVAPRRPTSSSSPWMNRGRLGILRLELQHRALRAATIDRMGVHLATRLAAGGMADPGAADLRSAPAERGPSGDQLLAGVARAAREPAVGAPSPELFADAGGADPGRRSPSWSAAGGG